MKQKGNSIKKKTMKITVVKYQIKSVYLVTAQSMKFLSQQMILKTMKIKTFVSNK